MFKWTIDHKELLITVILLGAGATKGITKIVSNHHQNYVKNTMIYDRVLGGYVTLKRPLTHAQQRIVIDRHANGEPITKILLDLGLLK